MIIEEKIEKGKRAEYKVSPVISHTSITVTHIKRDFLVYGTNKPPREKRQTPESRDTRERLI